MSAQDKTLTAEALLAGAKTTKDAKKTFREKLADLFSGNDLVTIKNTLGVKSGYVYTDPKDEQVSQPDRVTRRVEFGDPKAVIMEADETKTVPGWQAYIALGRWFKEYAQQDPANLVIILASDAEQNAFIKRSYLGIFDPNAGTTTAPVINDATTAPSGRAGVADNLLDAAKADSEADDLGFAGEEAEEIDEDPSIKAPVTTETQEQTA